MYHYHKKTHDLIPVGQLCEQGCGKSAKFKNTNGKYSCEKVVQQCLEYVRKHSERISEQWQRPESVKRKEETKERFFEHCCGVPEAVNKMKETKRKKSGLLTPQDAKNYRHYARAIRQRAQIWAKEQGYEIGQQTFHVDHKLSILDAWHAGLSESIVNHPANLQIIEARQNSSKGSKSNITVEELLMLADLSN
jgi:hypothetical protein